jgi:NhaP-type Na+/H+ or K+/H+ antiporter
MEFLQQLKDKEILFLIIFLAYIVVSLGFVLFIAKSKALTGFLMDDTTKSPSTGRMVILILIMAYVFVAGFLSIVKGTFPDIPVVVAGVIIALYGIKNGADAWTTIKGCIKTPPQEPEVKP